MKPATYLSGSSVDTVIIGAGPYGLSLAAYLAANGISFRIFGVAMSAWSEQMPKGMLLKSEGFASSLADPGSAFTLARYCHEQGLPYADTGLPVPLETFVAYGLAFQKKYAPNLENKTVVSVDQSASGFELKLDDGEQLSARRVVVAVGISQFAHIPSVLAELPKGAVSHSSAHSNLDGFKGREVAVVGAGASALDLAALLHEAGARVQLVARGTTIKFHDPPAPRSLIDRIRKPTTGLGAGMQLFFYCTFPHLFRLLPENIRLDRVRKTLGPAPGWFIKDRIVNKVPFHLGCDISAASSENGHIKLQLTGDGGLRKEIQVNHVIAATGYKIDVSQLHFLSSAIQRQIRLIEKSPRLSGHFESSVSGLYFIGVTGANTFGPLMRFAYGARYAARRLSKRLTQPVRHSVPASINMGESRGFERS